MERVQTAYSRVTVLTTDRTIDLALPSALPLADVLPQVMRYAAPESGDDGAPTSWTLARVGGSPVSLSQTLAEAGVIDGEVLELRPETADVRPALVEDVRDAVEDSVDAAGGVWTTPTTGSFAVLAGSTALAVLAVLAGAGLLADVRRWEGLDAPVSAFAAVAVLLFATWWASWRGHETEAQVAAAVAMAWGALLAVSVGSSLGLDPHLTVALAVLLVAVVAGVARLLTAAATAHLAFAAILLVAGAVAAVAATTTLPVEHVRRVLPVVALLCVGVVPRVSLSVGGLASADYRVRHVGRLDTSTLRSRYRASNAILVGSVLGISTLVLWGGVSLLVDGGPWDAMLAVVLAVALVLRSRLFSRTQHMAGPRVIGLLVLGVAVVRYVEDHPDLMPWTVVAMAAAAAAGIGLATLPLSEIPRARVKRTLNIVEFLVVVVMLVVMVGALGVYDTLGGVFE